ncbi:MAG: T9SS type A sorting domain-containing protein [Lacibacter sp.]
MKKILLLLLLLATMPLYNNSIAQCIIKNVIVKVNSSVPSATIPGACDVNFDFIFTIENNGGNKYIYMHAWLDNNYPNYFQCPPPPNNAKPPVAADLALTAINLGIHNEIHAGHPAPTLIQTYYPDPTIILTAATGLTRGVYPSGDSARFTIKGVQITVPQGCNDVISMKADFWSSQGQIAQNAQCVNCGVSFTIDPRVNGFVNCSNPSKFNTIITSVAPFSISGTYEVYLDYPSDPLVSGSIGTYGPEDIVLVYSSSYTTTVAGAVNNYIATNIGYLPYSINKPDADRNLWVVVSTNGYSNKAINLLVNACAPLDLKLVNFNAQKNDGNVMLQWQTADENNMSGFYVERKTGSGAFESIVFVQAKSEAGNAIMGFAYSYYDVTVTTGVAFYRLKMVEVGGKYSYSDIRAVRIEGGKLHVTIHPNPSNGTFKVALPLNVGSYDVILTDYCGKVLRQMSGIRSQAVQMNNLMPGIYVLKIWFRETGEALTERIVVQ